MAEEEDKNKRIRPQEQTRGQQSAKVIFIHKDIRNELPQIIDTRAVEKKSQKYKETKCASSMCRCAQTIETLHGCLKIIT